MKWNERKKPIGNFLACIKRFQFWSTLTVIIGSRQSSRQTIDLVTTACSSTHTIKSWNCFLIAQFWKKEEAHFLWSRNYFWSIKRERGSYSFLFLPVPPWPSFEIYVGLKLFLVCVVPDSTCWGWSCPPAVDSLSMIERFVCAPFFPAKHP